MTRQISELPRPASASQLSGAIAVHRAETVRTLVRAVVGPSFPGVPRPEMQTSSGTCIRPSEFFRFEMKPTVLSLALAIACTTSAVRAYSKLMISTRATVSGGLTKS